MALALQYTVPFYSLNGTFYVVELWKEGGDGNTVEVQGMEEPFKIEYPTVSKFNPVCGSGCELNILSETSMQFVGLHHIDPKEWQVRLKRDGSYHWFGWLDPELYVEPYHEWTNYPIQFTGSDFSVFERLDYVQLNGEEYIEIRSHWEMILDIVERNGLPFSHINVALSTVVSGMTHTNTILHDVCVSGRNFYDEEKEPMNMYEVLESMLKPYSARIIQYDGQLWIYDIHTVADNISVEWWRYNMSSETATTEIIGNRDSIDNIKWCNDKQEYSIEPGINKQFVEVSLYTDSELKEVELIEPEDWTGEPDLDDGNLWTDIHVDNVQGNYWKLTNNYAHDNWEIPNLTVAGMSAVHKDTDGDRNAIEADNADIFFKYDRRNSGTADWANDEEVLRLTDLGYLVGNYKSGIRITFDFKPTAGNPYYIYQKIENEVFGFGFTFSIWVGNRCFYNQSSSWSTGESLNYTAKYLSNERLLNRWTNEFSFVIPLNPTVNGNVKIILHNHMTSYTIQGFNNNTYENCEYMAIRNFKAEIIEWSSKDLFSNDDIEYKGDTGVLWKEEGEKVTLTQGSNTVGNSSARGGLLLGDGAYWERFDTLSLCSRGGNSDILEKLLINSIISNFTGGTTQLTGTLNYYNLINIITDSFIPGALLMFAGGTFNVINDEIECTVLEIKPDLIM